MRIAFVVPLAGPVLQDFADEFADVAVGFFFGAEIERAANPLRVLLHEFWLGERCR